VYLMKPLHMHFDFGFGSTADQFKESADLLSKTAVVKDLVMPLNYLRRHAVELYLKSLIYILHRKYDIPFSDQGDLENPLINVRGKNKLLTNLHDIGVLFSYFIKLHNSMLSKFPDRTDWSIGEDIRIKVNSISGIDSKSTFFRYPKTGDRRQDVRKSKVKEVAWEDMLERMNVPSERKVKAMLLFDNDDNLIQSFDIDSDVVPELQDTLNSLCEFFYCLHAAYRYEICKGE